MNRIVLVGLAGFLLCGLAACRTTAPTLLSDAEIATARAKLGRPLPGDMAALYRLRVPSSGGLRLAVLTRGDTGRLTISEPFGSAVSLTSWTGPRSAQLYDLKAGCRVRIADVSRILRVSRLPLPEVVRLLGGRLPAVGYDRVAAGPAGTLTVRGDGWSCRVRLGSDPWRVLEVTGPAEADSPAWRIRLSRHTSSVPGFVRADRRNGDWAELELVRLEWNVVKALPPLPVLPECAPPRMPSLGRPVQ